MRKIVLFLAVLFMTVPAIAVSNVNIYCDEDGNKVTLSYEVTDEEPNLIRAFGLYITVEDANIIKVEELDPNYRIYPGQISIEDGEVNEYKTSYDPCDIGDANVTIEMGSLYTTDSNYAGDPNAGYNMKPGSEGTLLAFYLDSSSGYTYTVSEDPNRGGVVMEDPYEEPNVIMCAEPPTDCLKDSDPGYATWVDFGKPDCWCYRKQCHGDADGQLTFGKPVMLTDLNILKAGYGLADTDLKTKSYGGYPAVCGNFDHQKTFGKQVMLADLNILKAYYGLADASVPCCDADQDCILDAGDDYNFWTN